MSEDSAELAKSLLLAGKNVKSYELEYDKSKIIRPKTSVDYYRNSSICDYSVDCTLRDDVINALLKDRSNGFIYTNWHVNHQHDISRTVRHTVMAGDVLLYVHELIPCLSRNEEFKSYDVPSGSPFENGIKIIKHGTATLTFRVSEAVSKFVLCEGLAIDKIYFVSWGEVNE